MEESNSTEIEYRGFHLEYQQTRRHPPTWFVTVRYRNQPQPHTVGAGTATSPESAIALGQQIVDQRIEWCRQNRERAGFPCPYLDSMYE